MTKSKYAGKTVMILDEDGEKMPMDYIEAVDTYYMPLRQLAKKVGVSSRTLQRRIEAKKYDTAFDEMFTERLDHDSKIGDLINYPGQGRPKYVSPRLSLIIENYQKGGITKYLDKKQKDLVKKGTNKNPNPSSVSFFRKGDSHEVEINNDLVRLKEKIAEQEKKYINYYRRKLTKEINDDYVKTGNLADQDKFIENIWKHADQKQRVRFTEGVEEGFEDLKKDIMKLIVDYEYLMKMTQNWETDLLPYYGMCALVERGKIESEKKKKIAKEELLHQKQYAKILYWK